MDNVLKLKFINLPKDVQGKNLIEFQDMLGFEYWGYEDVCTKEYIILSSITKKGQRNLNNSIYKSLIAIGEDKEFAKKVAFERRRLWNVFIFS